MPLATRPAAVAGMFYPADARTLALQVAVAFPCSTRWHRHALGRAEDADRAARRLYLLRPGGGARLCTLAPGAAAHPPRGAARPGAPRGGARPGGADRGGVRHAARPRPARSRGDGRDWPTCRRWCAATHAHARSTRSRCSCRSCRRVLGASRWCRWRSAMPRRRGGRGDRAAVGRRRDADRHQLRPLALPAYDEARASRPRHGRAHPAPGPGLDHEQACGATPLTGCCWRRARTAWRRACSTCELGRHRRRQGARGGLLRRCLRAARRTPCGDETPTRRRPRRSRSAPR